MSCERGLQGTSPTSLELDSALATSCYQFVPSVPAPVPARDLEPQQCKIATYPERWAFGWVVFQVKSDESKRHRLILNNFEHGLNQQMSGFAALPLLIALRSTCGWGLAQGAIHVSQCVFRRTGPWRSFRSIFSILTCTVDMKVRWTGHNLP